MPKKLLLTYQSGAGGAWLTNLIYKLQKNQYQNEITTLKNFHQSLKSEDVNAVHCFKNPRDVNDLWGDRCGQPLDQYNKIINLGGSCTFNFYVNVIEKLYLDPADPKLIFTDDCFYSNLFTLFREATSRCVEPLSPDLDYAWLYQDPEKFINHLFELLDLAKIQYTKNIHLCMVSIDQFCRSCMNPADYINLNNQAWSAWGMAVLDHYNLLNLPLEIYQNKSQLISELEPHWDLIYNFTHQRMLQ